MLLFYQPVLCPVLRVRSQRCRSRELQFFMLKSVYKLFLNIRYFSIYVCNYVYGVILDSSGPVKVTSMANK